MVVFKLESLVLCGSTILLDGKGGNPRLGTGKTACSETSEIRISMRHPSLGYGREFQPAMRLRHADYPRVDAWAAFGAGRSLSRAGVLSSRSSARLATVNATTLSSRVTPAAIAVVQRCPASLAWCKPASRTPPASS
jgi:hypothetical protein